MILVTIATGHQLAPAPAASYLRMTAEGCPAGITSSWRSWASQAYLYAGWLARRPGFAFALAPGRSRHQQGYALDVWAAAAAWIRLWGAVHGWRFTNDDEWWHCEYFEHLDQHRLDAPPTPPAPPAPQPEEDDEMNARDYLTALYLQIVGRKPDVHAFASRLSAVATGTSWADVERSIKASPEAQAFARLPLSEQQARRGKYTF